MLLKRLILFWYPDALVVFIRTLTNLLKVIEEDLAVGLMWKLLFVPLFHDSSIIGRALSFLFRLSRVTLGVGAYAISTVCLLILGFIWFLTPPLFGLTIIGEILNARFLTSIQALVLSTITLVFGIALFLHKPKNEPAKKIWQIKNPGEVFQATKLKVSDLEWIKLLKSEEVYYFLQSLETTPQSFLNFKPNYFEKLFPNLLTLAKATGAKYLTESYFFVAMVGEIPNIEQELLKINLKLEDFKDALVLYEHKRSNWKKVFVWDEDFEVRHLKGTNRGWISTPAPLLDSVSDDLTRQAASTGVEDFTGRKNILNEVITILTQDKDRNVLLVGPAGSGKTALVKFLAKMIVSGNAPSALATKRIVKLDLARLISDVAGESELAKKIKTIFEEIEFSQSVILFIDEIHMLGLGQMGDEYNLYSLMIPYLESKSFQFIASTEDDNYFRILEKNTVLIRIFHKVVLPPASKEDTFEILKERAVELVRSKKITLTYPAIKKMLNLSERLISDRVLPDSALSVLEECEAAAKNGVIDSKLVTRVFENRVNIPIIEINAEEKKILLDLENIIHQRLIDQEDAVKAVASTLRRSAAELKDDTRPIGSFLFVGPTGVGKTELAKILSEIYFKTREAYLRFDMSEYQTHEAVDRLLGTQTNPGELTEAVKNKPYCLILLDEFEKANPKILNLFLQVLEDGRLTDALGKTVDFRNTIIIATSNAASLTIAEGLKSGKGLKDLEGAVKFELFKIFKPELINRFDNVTIFKPLSGADLEAVVKLKLNDLLVKLKEKGYLVDLSPELISELAKRGYDPVLGARPLRRLIQDTLESNLSKMILEDKLKKGEKLQAGINLLAS